MEVTNWTNGKKLCVINMELKMQNVIAHLPFTCIHFPLKKKIKRHGTDETNLSIKKNTTIGKNWENQMHDRVCSRHFPDSKPTPENPDPILELGYDSKQQIAPKRAAPKPRSLHPTKKTASRTPRKPTQESPSTSPQIKVVMITTTCVSTNATVNQIVIARDALLSRSKLTHSNKNFKILNANWHPSRLSKKRQTRKLQKVNKYWVLKTLKLMLIITVLACDQNRHLMIFSVMLNHLPRKCRCGKALKMQLLVCQKQEESIQVLQWSQGEAASYP